MSPIDGRDWLGFDNGARALPAGFPTTRSCAAASSRPTSATRRTRSRPSAAPSTTSGSPEATDGQPGQNWAAVYGQPLRQTRHRRQRARTPTKRASSTRTGRFYRDGGSRRARSQSATTTSRPASQRAQLGIVGNVAYQFTRPPAVASRTSTRTRGRDEGRFFQGDNTENLFDYQNYRLQFIEEGLLSNGVSGEHFFPGLGNSRVDWRVTVGAGQPRRARLARDAVPAAHRTPPADFVALGRVAERLPHVQHARGRLDRRGGELEPVQHGRRPADAVEVRVQRRRSRGGTSSRGGSATSRSSSTRTACRRST